MGQAIPGRRFSKFGVRLERHKWCGPSDSIRLRLNFDPYALSALTRSTLKWLAVSVTSGASMGESPVCSSVTTTAVTTFVAVPTIA